MNNPLVNVCFRIAAAAFYSMVLLPHLFAGELAEKESSPRAQGPLFKDAVAPVLQVKCIRCHNQETSKGGLDLSSLESLNRGGENGSILIPGDPEKSTLLQVLADGRMPQDKKLPVTEKEREQIYQWVLTQAKKELLKNGFVPGAADSLRSESLLSQHDILPIMRLRCTVCHGKRLQQGELDLSSRASMLKGGNSGPAIVLGDAEASLVIQKIHSGEMPPNKLLVDFSVKPITPRETKKLADWINLSAPEIELKADIAGTDPDPLVAGQDRNFWSFQSLKPVEVPVMPSGVEGNNPVDAFVFRKLHEKGLSFSPEADRITLLRRATFDLTGMPPSVKEIEEFLKDTGEKPYERMIERLLESRRYGERWGRYWLDLVGYADSEGKRSADPVRPYAYRYRDYVIRAFNSDKSYARFLLEQIAGDELADYENAPEITQELYDNLVATGFLRMAPDGTGSDVVNFVEERIEVISDQMDVFGASVLGLTLKCARCHTHKYDPIPQRDYYRLTDIFKGAFDEHDWLKPAYVAGQTKVTSMGRVLPYVTTEERKQWEKHQLEIDTKVTAIKADLENDYRLLAKKYFEETLSMLPEPLRDDLRTTFDTEPEKRTEIQQYLADKFQAQLIFKLEDVKNRDEAFKQLAADLDARVKQLESRKLPEPKIRALWDRGTPSPTYIYRRGDYLNPGRLVGPGVPSVLTDGASPFVPDQPWPGAQKTGRRLALARWLIQPEHPLTSRVMINRIWHHHFGKGLVATLDNFGKTGTYPSHPELLDWLAGEFINNGWSMKQMHRLLMNSRTYRQQSRVTAEHDQRDPENQWWSHMSLRRMDAEEVRDSLLYVSGRLDETPFGPGDPVETSKKGLVTSLVGEKGWRRSIYVKQRRKEIPTILEAFDLPQMNPNCIERAESTVVSQALYLWNNKMMYELSHAFANRIEGEVTESLTDQVDHIYMLAFNRPPSAEEQSLGIAALGTLAEVLTQELTDLGTEKQRELILNRALTEYCHTILNSAAFIYVD